MKPVNSRFFLLALSAMAAAGCSKTPLQRPNVIFILMDDAGYGDFGCYGQQKIEIPQTDGISFLPTLQGRKQEEHDFLYWEYPGGKGWIAVRMGDWKGVLTKVQKGNRKIELYNLAQDPREEHDIASEHPEIVEELWHCIEASHTQPDNPNFQMDISR